jgi:cytochrome b
MQKMRAYDLPTRLFHWLFAGLFVFALGIAKWIDDDSPLFAWHMMAGLSLSFLVGLRILWGVIGSKTARFTSFPLHPRKLGQYFFTLFTTNAKRYFAHNPASAWAALTMMILALSLGATGVLMANGQKESLEDIHELLAHAFLVVAGAHVLGVLFQQIRHRDGIIFAMFHGKKQMNEEPHEAVRSHPFAALVMGGAFVLFAVHVFYNYNATRGTTQVFGYTLQLGENEGSGEAQEGHAEEEDD